VDSGSITSAGGNLIGENTNANTATFGTTGAPNANNDYVGTGGGVINPMLAALAFAPTGTTRVHLPMTGSLAIDRGVDANAVNPFDSQPLVTDQRGAQRIFDGG
ncbi:MAG TPA: choice-of-anchor Q domain-containing protein, partial [Pyrinomonadaceae bacterium]|nr:choice-of-anchor Q domain-containing protein [Pyrinomonadaceae bacterium]